MNAQERAAEIVGKYVGFSDPAIYAPLIADVAAALTEAATTKPVESAVLRAEKIIKGCEHGHELELPQGEACSRCVRAAILEAAKPSPALVEFIEAGDKVRQVDGHERDSRGRLRLPENCLRCIAEGDYDTALAALRKEMGL